MGYSGPPIRSLLVGFGLAAVLAACSAPAAPAPSAAKPGAGSAPASGAPASGGAASASAGQGATPALVPIKIAYTTIAAVQAPFWIADDAGYFREHGLDVGEMRRVEPGATLLAALHNGELEFVAAGGPSLILGNLQGIETMIFGSTLDLLETVVVAGPDVRTVEDLRGKIIAVSRLKAISDLAARLGVQRYGLDPDRDVTMRGTGGNAESLAALTSGTVGAASLSVPAVFEANKRGFPDLINVTNLRIPFTNGALGATKTTLERRPELAEKVLRATAQATARFKTDPEYAAQVVGKVTSITDPEALRGTIQVYAPIMQVDPYPDRAAIQAVLDAEDHADARTTRFEQLVDTRPADALRRSGFLDRLPKD